MTARRPSPRALVACGLGKDEHVGVLMTNRAEFLSSVFGIALAGGVAAPISSFSTVSELEHLIASAACSILLVEPRVLKKDFVAMLCELEPDSAERGPATWLRPRFRSSAMWP
jgi:fatty-acyl-CoA synthase